ncbi:spore coat protein [Paenibacillus daejeonensis]|uniref:spore coat protein n=1 Tax=Paenibacillus daejeonensis TaxID=135193 RepID=UPI00037B1751|nr:spore coat protein [Paenibacillus daejeonensis]
MNQWLERITGMYSLSDQVLASDLLIAAKNGVRNYAIAMTETISPEIREALTRQLEEAIDHYENVADYMMRAGLYHPWHVNEQIQLDMRQARAALELPQSH